MKNEVEDVLKMWRWKREGVALEEGRNRKKEGLGEEVITLVGHIVFEIRVGLRKVGICKFVCNKMKW